MNIFLKTTFTILILFKIIYAKYETIYERIELPLGDNDQLLSFPSYRIKKFNKSVHVESGVMTFKIPLDDSIIISFEAFNLVNGRYKKIFANTLRPFCQFIYGDELKENTQKWFMQTNISEPYGTCPLSAQSIMVYDRVPDGFGEYLPNYVPGSERWKISLWGSRNDKIIGGINFYVILKDNEESRNG